MTREVDWIRNMATDIRQTAIDCFELPDGRMVQLTVKLETDERWWLNMAADIRQAIKDRDAKEGAV